MQNYLQIMTIKNSAFKMIMIVTLMKNQLRQNHLLVLVELHVITIKLELFSNILLILDANDLKQYCGKAIHRVESSSAKYNISVIKEVKSSFTEYNLPVIKELELSSTEYNSPVIQGVKSSLIEHNASALAKLSIVDDVNNVKLCDGAIIKTNKYFLSQ